MHARILRSTQARPRVVQLLRLGAICLVVVATTGCSATEGTTDTVPSSESPQVQVATAPSADDQPSDSEPSEDERNAIVAVLEQSIAALNSRDAEAYAALYRPADRDLVRSWVENQGKLDRWEDLDIEKITLSGDTATVQSTFIFYSTAAGSTSAGSTFRVTATDRLARIDGRWYIVTDINDPLTAVQID